MELNRKKVDSAVEMTCCYRTRFDSDEMNSSSVLQISSRPPSVSSEEDTPIDPARFANYRPRSFDSEEAICESDAHIDKSSFSDGSIKEGDDLQRVAQVAKKQGIIRRTHEYLFGSGSKNDGR